VTRLVVDARVLYGSGIGRYVRALVPRVVAQGGFTEVTLVGDPAELRPWAARQLPGAAVVPLVAGRYALRAQLAWPRGLLRTPGTPRVVWFPHFDAPLLGVGAPSVVTVHDLIPLHPAHGTGPLRRALLRAVVRRVTARAAAVLTVSEGSAAALVDAVPWVGDRLTVVPNGGAEFAALSPGRLPREAQPPYALVVANHKPHKDLPLAFSAVARLRGAGMGVSLVVVGEPGAATAALVAHATALGLGSALQLLGVVDDATLRALYGSAAVLLAPSRVEGFGLPVVEALACGTPVVAADLPWARAVGGPAARYAAVGQPEAWADTVATVLTAGRVAGEAGPAWAARFTWDRAAAAVARVLHAAAA
jgi:glycosyltransferase involved in cell wall biosynthesis